jgi:hypothetical protein
MLDYLTNLPFILGLVMLAATAYMIWRKPSDAQPVAIVFLAGVALIVLSDDRISIFKFSASGGLEVTRKEIKDKVDKAQVDYAGQIADINGKLEQQKNLLEALTKGGARPADPAQPNQPRPTVAPGFAENSKYSILVYYRDSADARSGEVVSKLVTAGFKSAKVNTDLTEVGRAMPNGSVRIRFNEGREEVAKRVAEVLKDGATLDPRAATRNIPGDVQILLY